jgi:hypothetical protein
MTDPKGITTHTGRAMTRLQHLWAMEIGHTSEDDFALNQLKQKQHDVIYDAVTKLREVVVAALERRDRERDSYDPLFDLQDRVIEIQKIIGDDHRMG